TLPTLPDANYPQGYVVFLTTDNKLYRSTGSTWTVAVPTVDLTGLITTAQIADAAVTAAKLSVAIGGGNELTNSGFEDTITPLNGYALYNNGPEGATLTAVAGAARYGAKGA